MFSLRTRIISGESGSQNPQIGARFLSIREARFDRLIDSKAFRALRSTAYAEMPELYSRIGSWNLGRDQPGMVLNLNVSRYHEMRDELRQMHTSSKDGAALEEVLGRCPNAFTRIGKVN